MNASLCGRIQHSHVDIRRIRPLLSRRWMRERRTRLGHALVSAVLGLNVGVGNVTKTRGNGLSRCDPQHITKPGTTHVLVVLDDFLAFLHAILTH
ncbi:hypothetical protein BDQ12DRAFT_129670 [Crucibulum laeve]|uniref:Uncharacterized protein n=1 Tax=Crucibulum laeve TaxID=68775 RepID=A0A5C3LHV1_9AGAR|nr:hypothetical protein BDQ12DRAFT_129670 [Crucibulum laeve]